jgi:hypothetical protein
MNTNMNKTLVSLGCVLAAACAHAAAPSQPSPKALQATLTKYLAQQGDLCVGKFEWPIDVAPGDAEAGSRDAVQLPVMERLGLVSAVHGVVLRKDADGAEREVPVQRYSLTEAGRMFYVSRARTTVTPAGETITRPGDFCVAKLKLDKVTGWDAALSTASYTYKITAAGWMNDPAMRQVFPMVAYVLQGEGKLQMKQRLRRENNSWVAVPAGE